MRKLFGFLIITTLLCACKTKVLTPEAYEKRMITFGNGGGFTGAVDTYVLLENGQLFNKKAIVDGEFASLPNLDQDLVDQIFDNFYALNMDKSIISDPGNLSYFVEMKTQDKTHALKWGGDRQVVNDNIKRFYTNLINLAQKQKKEMSQDSKK